MRVLETFMYWVVMLLGTTTQGSALRKSDMDTSPYCPNSRISLAICHLYLLLELPVPNSKAGVRPIQMSFSPGESVLARLL